MSNLDNLPDINFIKNLTVEDLRSSLIADYEQRLSELKGKETKLAQASEQRLVLYGVAAILYQMYQYINRGGRNNLLKYAYGDYLDNLAALKGITRSSAKPASVIVRFAMSETRSTAVGIPAGTRVSPDGDVFFEVPEYSEILAGSLYADIECVCTDPGIEGNGFEVGEINTLVDPVNYIATVSNTTVSEGGANIEDDEAFRERIFLAPAAYSVAGPEAAYVYWAKTYSPAITDVNAVTEEGSAVVQIRFLMDGAIPSAAMVQNLEEYLADENIRPLTDMVEVSAPTASSFNINVSYCINKSDRNRAATIQAAVADAVNNYTKWQTEKIGRDINPSKLTELMMAAGAKRVVVTSPTYTVIDNEHVAAIGTTNTVYNGLEDD